MSNEEIAVKLAELDQKCRSLSHRMEAVENMQTTLAELTKSIEIVATKQDYIAKQTEHIASKVEIMEQAPGDNWKTVVRTVLTAAVSALITFAVTKIFS